MSGVTFASSVPSSRANRRAFDIEKYFVRALQNFADNSRDLWIRILTLTCHTSYASAVPSSQDDCSIAFCGRMGYDGHFHYEIRDVVSGQLVPSAWRSNLTQKGSTYCHWLCRCLGPHPSFFYRLWTIHRWNQVFLFYQSVSDNYLDIGNSWWRQCARLLVLSGFMWKNATVNSVKKT